jgi:DDE superfamily endonuclease
VKILTLVRIRVFTHAPSRYSILPALSLDGILHLDIQVGAYTAETFKNFVSSVLECMCPFPERNSVIVMDNASIHKSNELKEMIEAQYVTSHGSENLKLIYLYYSGMCLIFLPPYSPNFNPIEEAFSSIKAWIWRDWNYIQGELIGNAHQIFVEAVYTVMPEKVQSWFAHEGYL